MEIKRLFLAFFSSLLFISCSIYDETQCFLVRDIESNTPIPDVEISLQYETTSFFGDEIAYRTFASGNTNGKGEICIEYYREVDRITFQKEGYVQKNIGNPKSDLIEVYLRKITN